MPQLDHVSYFSQFFWLSILFLTFYLVLVQNFLPKIATILKMRKKLILQTNNTNNVNENIGSADQILSSHDQVLLKGLKEAKDLLSVTSKLTNTWVLNTQEQITNRNLATSHVKYVESIGDILGKKYLLQTLLK